MLQAGNLQAAIDSPSPFPALPCRFAALRDPSLAWYRQVCRPNSPSCSSPRFLQVGRSGVCSFGQVQSSSKYAFLSSRARWNVLYAGYYGIRSAASSFRPPSTSYNPTCMLSCPRGSINFVRTDHRDICFADRPTISPSWVDLSLH